MVIASQDLILDRMRVVEGWVRCWGKRAGVVEGMEMVWGFGVAYGGCGSSCDVEGRGRGLRM